MITRILKFMAPADDAGGGTAVLDALPASSAKAAADKEAPMTPVGEIYKAALAKAQGEEPDAPEVKPDAKKAAPAKEAAAKEPAKADEPKAETKPTSALEAALGDTPAVEKKEEAPVDPLADYPEEPVDGQKRNWKGLRGVADTAIKEAATIKAEVARLTKELETAKSAPPELAQQNADLKAKLDSYKDVIVAINLEMDPEFRAKFTDGRAALVNKAAAKLNAFGGKGEALKDALGMPEGRGRTQAIKEALGELEDVERSRVLQFVGEVEKLDDERADLQKDPQQAWEKLQRTQTELRQKQGEAAEAYKKEVFETVSKNLPAKLTLLKTVDPSIEGATEWNNGVQEIKDGAFKLLGNDATPEQLAEAALWATAGPKIQERWLADRGELAKARSALKEYEESEPGFRGGKPPKKSEPEAKLEKTAGQVYTETLANERNAEN